MELLPNDKDGTAVYSGFWPRTGASVIDGVILLLIGIIPDAIGGLSTILAVITIVISSTLYSIYTIVFHHRYGATLGKMAVKIKVTKPDGSPISLSQSVIRSSIYFIFGVLLAVFQIGVLSQIQSMEYLTDNLATGLSLSSLVHPLWFGLIMGSLLVWTLCEIVTFMLSKKHKALHDVMAGTVVIDQRFQKQNNESPMQHKM